MPIDNKKKSLIHVAKTKVGMSEDEYRAMLEGFGVASSSELSQTGFEAVMKHFEKLGFVARKKFNRPADSKKRLMSKVEAIKADMKLPAAYLDAMSLRMFKNKDGHPVASYRWLDAHQLHKLVAALSYHQKKKKA
jgi:phage gp16-like protein